MVKKASMLFTISRKRSALTIKLQLTSISESSSKVLTRLQSLGYQRLRWPYMSLLRSNWSWLTKLGIYGIVPRSKIRPLLPNRINKLNWLAKSLLDKTPRIMKLSSKLGPTQQMSKNLWTLPHESSSALTVSLILMISSRQLPKFQASLSLTSPFMKKIGFVK